MQLTFGDAEDLGQRKKTLVEEDASSLDDVDRQGCKGGCNSGKDIDH